MVKGQISLIMKNRAEYYAFLSRCLEREMKDTDIKDLEKMAFPQGKGFDLLKSYLSSAVSDKEEDLAVDFAHTFLGAGEVDGKAAYPYESVYTSRERLVMQDAWSQVRNIYGARGLALEASEDIKEDHAAIELLYMCTLAQKAADKPSKDIIDAQLSFLDAHILNWMPAFCEDIRKYSRTDFYKAVASILEDFINEDKSLLSELALEKAGSGSSYRLSRQEMDKAISALRDHYRVFAPKLIPNRTADGKDIVRYQEISSVDEIVYDRQTDFSPKEIYYPVMQTMIFFTDTDCEESLLVDDREIIIFAHPCDINAVKRLDTIFLENGGRQDTYYKRLREKVKFVMMECSESYANCFCVSMGTNSVEGYDMAVRIDDEGVSVKITLDSLQEVFDGCKEADYEPAFIQSNERKVMIPQIDGQEALQKASHLEFWDKYNDKCIGCGGCNTVCPTCSCFDTVDIRYDETSLDGERRRVWSSCMLDTFTMTAGGAKARQTPGENMRFKALHKMYDFRQRFDFDGNMCVGCGRCVNRCPQEIDFIDTINGFRDALEQGKGGN